MKRKSVGDTGWVALWTVKRCSFHGAEHACLHMSEHFGCKAHFS